MARSIATAPDTISQAESVRTQLMDGRDWLDISLGNLPPSDNRTRDERCQAFLRSIAETPSITAACDAAGISRDTAYRWQREDERFAKLWEVARLRPVDNLEATVYRRAMAGDTLLLMFATKAALNHYRDSYVTPQVTTARQSLRFMLDTERDSAIQGEYATVPALPSPDTAPE